MKKIGNILTVSNFDFGEQFNISDSFDFDNLLPTLVIGYKMAKKHFPDKINAANNNLDEKIFWTFERLENRSKFDVELEEFGIYCLEEQIKGVDYIFVDLIHYSKRKLFKIIRKILNTKPLISVIYRDMVYIYGDGIIFGVDLQLVRFVGISRNKILNKINDISTVTLHYEDIIIKYKTLLRRVDNQVRYLPILYFINDEES